MAQVTFQRPQYAGNEIGDAAASASREYPDALEQLEGYTASREAESSHTDAPYIHDRRSNDDGSRQMENVVAR